MGRLAPGQRVGGQAGDREEGGVAGGCPRGSSAPSRADRPGSVVALVMSRPSVTVSPEKTGPKSRVEPAQGRSGNPGRPPGRSVRRRRSAPSWCRRRCRY